MGSPPVTPAQEFREPPPSLWTAAWDIRQAERGGASSVTSRQRTRLAAMIAFARRHSPFYRSRYGHLPDETSLADLALLFNSARETARDSAVHKPILREHHPHQHMGCPLGSDNHSPD